MAIKKLINSFTYAIMGIKSAIKTEQNMKIHLLIMEIVILMALILNISFNEWLIVLICFMVVISSELFNTALEKCVDLASPNKNEIAKLAKDISAGAVLITAIFAAIIGIIIFLPKIIIFVKGLII